MESQPQNPEFRNNPENFHICMTSVQFDIRMEMYDKFRNLSPW